MHLYISINARLHSVSPFYSEGLTCTPFHATKINKRRYLFRLHASHIYRKKIPIVYKEYDIGLKLREQALNTEQALGLR
jgi:hypothetical protein